MTSTATRLDSVALTELQSLPAPLLRGLPVPTCVTVRLPGEIEARLNLVGDAEGDGVAAFAPEEVEALACAVEHGRADAADVIGWIARKRSEPGFRLDLAGALQGVPAPARVDWSLGRVLREIRAVIIEGALIPVTPIALPRAA